MRESSIISPEGYCPHCSFLVALADNGLMITHWPGYSMGDKYNVVAACPGSDKRPSTRVPYFSRRAMFREVGTRVWCPGCSMKAPTVKVGGIRVYATHFPDEFKPRCHRSGGPVGEA